MKSFQLMISLGLLLSMTSAISAMAVPGSTSLSRPTNRERPVSQIGGGFEPPPNQDRPAQTAGGGSRDGGRCLHDPIADHSLGALTPTELTEVSMDAPTAIPIQIPETTARAGEFSVFDANGNGVYQVMLPLTGIAEVVHIALPVQQVKLQPGHAYQWVFAMICEPGDRLQDRSISGWIRPTATDRLSNEERMSHDP